MNDVVLPTDLGVAHAMIRELRSECDELRSVNLDLQHQLDRMARRMFGRRSEQLDPHQTMLAFEALVAEGSLAPDDVPSRPARGEKAAEAAPKARRPGHGRRPLPKDLPRETRVVQPDPQDLVCACCGQQKARIGEERCEQLDYVPAHFRVVETLRPKYACSRCKDGVTVALAPRNPVQKGLATAALLAYVAVSKYVDHLPLARQSGIFERLGVEVPRQTLCSWIERIFELLAPVEAALWASVLASRVLCADETPVQVLVPGRKDCERGYFWVYLGDQGELVLDFSMGRGSQAPRRALKGFRGEALLCDAYSGYDQLPQERPGLVRAGCWAHARRKVYEAQDTDPVRAMVLLALIGALYDVEAAVRAQEFATRQEREAATLLARTTSSRPVMEQLGAKVAALSAEVLPKSPIGKALGYLTNQWDSLQVYLSDGGIDIDNNAVERAIRPIAVGRSNWTFVGSEDAGPWAARLYGLLGTCRLHDVNPVEWLTDVLGRVRDHPPDRMAELTPRLWKLAKNGTSPPT